MLNQLTASDQVAVAWAIVWLVILWSYMWKLLGFWAAARCGHIGWFVLFALPLPFGVLEMIYVFWLAPRYADGGGGGAM